jgi:hypothetical protein
MQRLKKYDQTNYCAPKYLPRVTKTVMYAVNISSAFLAAHQSTFENFKQRSTR